MERFSEGESFGRYGGRQAKMMIGHAAVCEWHEVHPESGKTWREMWGTDEIEKKLNFFLHRRGLLKLDEAWPMRNR